MDNFAEFFSMGGYASFVWPSYILSIGVLFWLVISSFNGLLQEKAKLDEIEKNNPRVRNISKSSKPIPHDT